jgi:hypothetical protein
LLLLAASSVYGQELPEGKGKEVVARHCTGCHAFRAGGGYTPKGWATVMRMMTNHGLVMSPDEVATAKSRSQTARRSRVRPVFR